MPLIPSNQKETGSVKKKRGPIPICDCQTCEVCKARIRQQNFYRRKKLGYYDSEPESEIPSILGNKDEI